MPDGFGFNWPGHGTAGPIGCWPRSGWRWWQWPAGRGRARRRSLAAASGVRLPAAAASIPRRRHCRARNRLAPQLSPPVVGVYPCRARHGNTGRSGGGHPRGSLSLAEVPDRSARRSAIAVATPPLPGRLPSFALVFGAVIAVAILRWPCSADRQTSSAPLATNPELDPGTPLASAAPDFTLTDQFGRPVSLHSFRGKVVILAFNDSECTTLCPLTTTAMVDAKSMLGPAADRCSCSGSTRPRRDLARGCGQLLGAARPLAPVALPHRFVA